MIRRWWRAGWGWVKGSGRFLVERPVRLGVFISVVLVGFAAGYPFADAGFDYMWKDPNMCDDCHVHDYANAAYFRSVHAGVTTCHDCHKVPFMHYPAEAWMMVADRPKTAEDIGPTRVPSVLCGACHLKGSTEELTGPMTASLRKEIVKVDDSPMHKLHFQAKSRDPGTYLGAKHAAGESEADAREAATEHASESEGEAKGEEEMVIGCLDCHGSGGNFEAHRFTADRKNCLECHGGVAVAVGRLKELRCQECHFSGFVGERPTDVKEAAAAQPD